MTNRQVDCGFANLAFDQVKSLRQAVGPGVEIILGLSGGLATDETIRLCQRFKELDITWIDEPADLFDVGALKTPPSGPRSRWQSVSAFIFATHFESSLSRTHPTSSSQTSATRAASWR